ncbi:MAG: tetratricopeptide repeat protein [Gemmatimonadetes bacterium]|nr:tetratricopeptide repeat protein [Gemmatimonadota bacterium]
MIETDRVLRPLHEAESAIGQLDTYESPAVLTEALRATWHAVDRTLRTLLRSDATAPDSIRLTAMSPELMSADAVMLELRRREFISLGLAGRVHELRQAMARAEAGGVRAADADNACDVVRRLTEEVHGIARRVNAGQEDDAPGTASAPLAASSSRSAAGPVTPQPAAAGDDVARNAGGARTLDGAYPRMAVDGSAWGAAQTRPLVFIAAMIMLLAIIGIAVVLSSNGSEMERGIAAFSDDRPAHAEQHFRAALQQDAGNNTARLYLARILRRDDRHEEAAQLLQAAAAQNPDDAAVRRELGYLFMDLGRPGSAAGQFRRAVENDAADPVNWTALVHALRQSGDSTAAAEWLRRAPAETRRMLENR